MKHYIFILLLIFLYNCNHKFKNYRYNPFQFPYKEYYYKAKVVEINSKNITEGEKYIFDEFYFILKNGFVDTMTFTSNIYHFYKNGKKIFIISKRVDDQMGCFDSLSRVLNKDFCSSANSMKEFYYKLFTLTPDSINKKEYAGIGNQWIIHQKGAFFEQISPPLTIYDNESYIAFRQNFRKTDRIYCEILIFPNSMESNYFALGFAVNDEELINAILTTLQKS